VNRWLRRLVDRLPPRFWWSVQKLRIRHRGWTNIALCDDAEKVFWTCSIGFDASLNHAEIVIANEGLAVAERLCGLAHRAIRARELVIVDGEAWDICGCRELSGARSTAAASRPNGSPWRCSIATSAGWILTV
jgi:hypothetical protein